MSSFFQKLLNAPTYFSSTAELVIVLKHLYPMFQYCFHLNPIPQDSEKCCKSYTTLSCFAIQITVFTHAIIA